MEYRLVGFEVLTAVIMKNTSFWDTTPCSPLKVSRRFGRKYPLHLQGRSISQETSVRAGGKQSPDYSLTPEDGGNMFFRYFG
jgi:hypothetical protein